MLSGVRYLLSDLTYWLRSNAGAAGLVLLGIAVVAAAAIGIYSALEPDSQPGQSVAPAPPAVVKTKTKTKVVQPADLGFPSFATRNTTRVAGADATADAAAVALATYPSAGVGDGPAAVSLVDADDWAGAIAASSLVAEPTRIPILFSSGNDLPEITASALATLSPKGSPATKQAQLLRIGAAPEVSDLKTARLGGGDEAKTAAAIAKERVKLTGEEPSDVVVVGLDDPAYAMPAASWAARSGDPVLFTNRDTVPAATIDALKQLKNVTVYVLGPQSAVSNKAFAELGKVAIDVRRITDADPVSSAVAFARYSNGDFGWDINDPGHGFVIANADRPADAGAASALSGSGTWGPLLVTDDAGQLPQALQGYLLDLKPGYTDDPTRAVYNHVWVIGDDGALSVEAQAEVDELAEVAPVSSGTGLDTPGAGSGQAGTSPPTPKKSQAKKPSGKDKKK